MACTTLPDCGRGQGSWLHVRRIRAEGMAQSHSARESGRIVSLRGRSVPDVGGTGRGRNRTGWSGAAGHIGRGGIPWHVRRHLAVHRGGVMPDAGLCRPLQPRLLRAERIDTQSREDRAFPRHRH